MRFLVLLLLVGVSLVLIRETGERIEYADHRLEFTIVARSDSTVLRDRVYGDYQVERGCSFRAESKRLGDERRQLPLRVITSHCDIHFGEVIAGAGHLRPSSEKRVAAMLIIDEVEIRESSTLWHSLHLLRLRFSSLFTSAGEAGALVPGMVIGDESLQDDQFQAAMRIAGLSHLTAVSGANFSIVATLILWLLSLRIQNKRVRIALTAVVLILFTLLVRPSPSVLRAGVMAAVVLIAQVRGDRHSGLHALAGAVTILLLIDPYQGIDPGFILSVLATLGIITLSPAITGYIKSHFPLPAVIAEMVAIPLSATILCSPVIVALSGHFSLASIPINIIVAPLVPLITVSGFVALLLTPLPVLAIPLAHLAAVLSIPIPYLARSAYQFPIIELAKGWQGAGIVLVTFLCVFLSIRASKRARGIILTALLLLPLFLFRGSDWQLYQCDVGQGDALLIRTARDSAILVDAGPDPDLIDRCLRKAGIGRISLLVITHLHADHFAGIEGVLRGRRIDSWWISPISAADPNLDAIKEIIGSEPSVVSEGMRFAVASTEIKVISPNPQGFPSINDSSLVLLVAKDDATILITGDIEIAAQDQIAHRYDLSDVDIYKVSHHGSRFRSSNFDAELDPQLALISVGEGNPFGHPAPETLERLEGARIFRTDREGAAGISWWPLRIH